MAGESEIKRDGVLRPHATETARLDAFLQSTTVQCHAANLMPLANGDLGCVFFGGTQEGMADISIHFARLAKGAGQWSPAVKLVDDPGRSEQNPILFPRPDGALWLLYTSQAGGRQETAVVRARSSSDNGHTWSVPWTLIEVPGTFVRQPVMVMADGTLLLPAFHCRTKDREPWTGEHDTSSVLVSTDAGKSWAAHHVPDSRGMVHMSIVERAPGRLAAFFRSRWADNIYRSASLDGGRTWSPPRPTTLPNNNASIQAKRLADGRIALVYNASSRANATERRASLYDDLDEVPPSGETGKVPSQEGGNLQPVSRAFWGAPRAPLALTFSRDGGLTWEAPRIIDTSDGYCITNNSKDGLNRELSYPSVTQTADGRLHLAFTWYRQAIKHVCLDLD